MRKSSTRPTPSMTPESHRPQPATPIVPISSDPRDYVDRFSPSLQAQTGDGWYRVYNPRSRARRILDAFIGLLA